MNKPDGKGPYYNGSKGVVPISTMNSYHLAAAIKKLERARVRTPEQETELKNMAAEQVKRGGPPKDARP